MVCGTGVYGRRMSGLLLMEGCGRLMSDGFCVVQAHGKCCLIVRMLCRRSGFENRNWRVERNSG